MGLTPGLKGIPLIIVFGDPPGVRNFMSHMMSKPKPTPTMRPIIPLAEDI